MNIFNLLASRQKQMKWPKSMLFIRHDVSRYNILKELRQRDELYQKFVREFNLDYQSEITRQLALEVNEKFALSWSDETTPLVEELSERAIGTGKTLRQCEELPDVIFVSPYRRTRQTLNALISAWPELKQVPLFVEERIREQSHGLANLYNDYRVFFALYPDQRKLYDQDGQYWFQWPQGENVPMVRDRVRSFIATMIRDFANKRVMVISHHLTKLAIRANFERWDAEEFLRVDREEKPINCGVTKYVGMRRLGQNGKFILNYYNQDLSQGVPSRLTVLN